MEKENDNPTQNTLILDYLQQGHSITPIEALRLFGCFRLGARIFNLREQGHNIKTMLVTKEGKRYAQYTLTQDKKP